MAVIGAEACDQADCVTCLASVSHRETAEMSAAAPIGRDRSSFANAIWMHSSSSDASFCWLASVNEVSVAVPAAIVANFVDACLSSGRLCRIVYDRGRTQARVTGNTGARDNHCQAVRYGERRYQLPSAWPGCEPAGFTATRVRG